MENRMVWVNEGFALNDAEHLIQTSYIDLRRPEDRIPIPSLVKGHERKYALEGGETILISKPSRFREYGEELIQDLQEGKAKEATVIQEPETAAQVAKQRVISDRNEALELLNSTLRISFSEKHTSTNTNSQALTYGKEWWIYCASIKPDQDQWGAWRSTLPQENDHVSAIGQPAKFAQALSYMVAEQLGPQGKNGLIRDTTEGAETEPRKCKIQSVWHGPVVYVDNVYEALAKISDSRTRIAAFIFTKETKYAAQREYRFAVLNDGVGEETVQLRISGMMKDALNLTPYGLVRQAPVPLNTVVADKSQTNQDTGDSPTPTHKRTTKRHRSIERQERRWETRSLDGQVLSSDSELREVVREQTADQDQDLVRDNFEGTTSNGEGKKMPPLATAECPEATGDLEAGHNDEKAVVELADEEFKMDDGQQEKTRWAVPIITGTGRAYRSIEEMLSDLTYPMSPAKETLQEKESTVDEVIKTYKAIAVLNIKMRHVKAQFRQDIASAGWYAMLCIRNIYAKLGDIVETLWIERERFVVIRLKKPGALNVKGRIVIAPSGFYAYRLQAPNKESLGHGGQEWGTLLFPVGSFVEEFEDYGWPKKTI